MLEFEPGLIIWTCVSFGLLVLLLYKLALPPILALLAQREKMIADSLNQAAANQKKSEDLLVEYNNRLAQVNQKAEAIVAAAKSEAEKAKAEILDRADKQAQAVAERTRQELGREKEAIVREVKQATAEIVGLAAGKIFRQKIDPDENRRLIEESIAEIKN